MRETLQWMAFACSTFREKMSEATETQEADKNMAGYLAFIRNENVSELGIPLLQARLAASSWCSNQIETIYDNSTVTSWLCSFNLRMVQCLSWTS